MIANTLPVSSIPFPAHNKAPGSFLGARRFAFAGDDGIHSPAHQRIEPGLPERTRKRIGELTINVQALPERRRDANGGDTVAFAARNVVPQPKSEELITKTTRGRKLRRVFFNQLETFIGTGQIKQEEFNKMRKGKGTLDVASDLIDSVALLEKYEPVLGGRLSVDVELLAEGQELGRWLRQTVEPSVSPKNDGLKKNEGSEVRDRLWTLLQRRHRELRRIGAWLWPAEVDKRVPSLLARQRKRKSKEREDAAEGGTESTPVCG